MKKITFLLLLLASLFLTGCSRLVCPANIKVIGVATIQNNKGHFFVQIDSEKYVPTFVYTNEVTRTGNSKVSPVEGMPVTVFTIRNDPQAQFMAGNLSKEYLEEYFFGNNTPHIVAMVLFTLACIAFIYLTILAIYVRKVRKWSVYKKAVRVRKAKNSK